MKKPDLILFDLDGTLVDSVPDLAFCIDEMMRALGRSAHGEDRVRGWVGNGVDRLVKRALTGELQAEPEEAEFARAKALFDVLYADNTSQRSQLFPGVREGLQRAADANIKLGCVTNKAGRFTEPLLRDMDIADYFGIAVSGDTLAQIKPHPAPLLHAAKFFGIEPSQALMVGDSMHDVEAARAAGFAVIAVSYGYNHGVDIREAKPDTVIDSLTELPALLGF